MPFDHVIFRDLADIHQRGSLNRDEFAIAMHLIHKRLAGDELPKTLPSMLLPPTERNTASLANAFSAGADAVGSSAMRG